MEWYNNPAIFIVGGGGLLMVLGLLGRAFSFLGIIPDQTDSSLPDFAERCRDSGDRMAAVGAMMFATGSLAGFFTSYRVFIYTTGHRTGWDFSIA